MSENASQFRVTFRGLMSNSVSVGLFSASPNEVDQFPKLFTYYSPILSGYWAYEACIVAYISQMLEPLPHERPHTGWSLVPSFLCFCTVTLFVHLKKMGLFGVYIVIDGIGSLFSGLSILIRLTGLEVKVCL